MATRYDLDTVYNWFAGGAVGNQPEHNGDAPNPDSLVLPFTSEKLAKDIIPAIAIARENGGAVGYNFAHDYTEEESFSKALSKIWSYLKQTPPYLTLDGDWFVNEFQISEQNTPIVYELLGDITPQERWGVLNEDERALIIFENLINYDSYKDTFTEKTSDSFFKAKVTPGGGSVYPKYNVPVSVQSKINIIYLLLDDDDVVDIYEQDIHNQKIDLDIDYGRLAPIDIIKQKLKQEQQKRTTLGTKEIMDELEKDGDNKTKALFKNLEQCFLLSAVPHFAGYRSAAREKTILDNRLHPYGGRIIPINCDPIENFMNYSSTTGDSYAFTRVLNTSLINAIDFNFIVSNVKKEMVSGKLMEVEMPILFGDQKNILRENQTGSFKHVTLFKKDGNENKSGSVDLDNILGSNQNLINQISYTDLKIDFIGENQATAKTNVDVSLTLQMPNLTYLQAEFDGVTTVNLPNGESVDHKYVYSPLDLITYLNRTNLTGSVTDISLMKYKGGAKLYSPKFFKNYNRLVMKIVPVYNEKGLSAYDKKVLELLKPYLDQNSLILDLALIDHTITRGVKTEGDSKDELKIEYKGYIRSFLQDPICDVLRNKSQMQGLINEETKLISKISKMKITPAANKLKVIQQIEKHNEIETKKINAHKESFQTNIFSSLKKHNQIWRVNYNPLTAVAGNISKDFEIIDAPRIRGQFMSLQPEPVQNEDVESINAKNLTEQELDLDFVYFGDLVDVLMNNMYKGEIARTPPTNDAPSKVADRGDVEQMEDDFKHFPLKILLPCFNPITYSAENEAWQSSDKKINLADFPIAVSWLSNWIENEIINSDTIFYSIGPFMNNIISSLVNGILVDNCYRNGVASFLQFAVKSDFGKFYLKDSNISTFNNFYSGENYEHSNAGEMSWDVLDLDKKNAPFFKKDAKQPRTDHCNFLVVYQQIAVFSNYKKLIAKKNYFKDYGIPYFNLLSKTPNGSPNVLTKAMTFNKATANYQRESRFQMESLYSLSQLASVYNVEIETSLLLLDVFPGMIIYTDAGLYQDSTVIGSIANTLGMGGFHLNEKVTHTATISGNKLLAPRTTISANWIYAGADEEADVEATGATPSPPSAPSSAPAAGGAPGAQPGTLGLVPSNPNVPNMREIIDRPPEATDEPSS